MERKKYILLILLSCLLLLAIVFSAGTGAMKIHPLEVISILMHKIGLPAFTPIEPGHENVLWAIRLPRVILSILIGAALAVSGASIQGLFRNPLADPGLIGISAGASLSAVVMIVMVSSSAIIGSLSNLAGYYTLNLVTFLGACLTSFTVYSLARSGGKTIVTTMLLAGIAINAFCGALIGLATFYSTDSQLRNITFWLLGSLGGASWNTVAAILPFILIPVIVIPQLSKSLNALSLGESEAGHIGVEVNRLKIQVIILSTMAVGASVAVAGIIGFVGLVVPHILRIIAGPDNRFIMVASSLAGAILLCSADMISRILVAPAELPIGIITALAGTPVFIWILLKHKKENHFA